MLGSKLFLHRLLGGNIFRTELWVCFAWRDICVSIFLSLVCFVFDAMGERELHRRVYPKVRSSDAIM